MTDQTAKTPEEKEFLRGVKTMALDVEVAQVENAIWATLIPILAQHNSHPGVVLVGLLNVVKQFVLAAPRHATMLCLELIDTAMMGLINQIDKRDK